MILNNDSELLNVYIVCNTKQGYTSIPDLENGSVGYTSIPDLENGSVSLPKNLGKSHVAKRWHDQLLDVCISIPRRIHLDS